jgi:hypothetical protein
MAAAFLASFFGDWTMTLRKPTGFAAALLVALIVAGASHAGGLGSRAKNALDPDCTAGKAARGAATKAVVGVRGNRCDFKETARDTVGIGDREKKQEDDGPLKKFGKD